MNMSVSSPDETCTGQRRAKLLRVNSIAPALLDEEQWNWVVDDHDNGQDDRVLGAQLLRHGNTVKKIHGYFRNLEARKCCMSLAGPKTSLTNIRLVRNDGRDSGIEEGAMSSQSVELSSSTKQLSDKEFQVYKHAFLCSEFPVLGAPDPPSAYTPPTTPLRTNVNTLTTLSTSSLQSTSSSQDRDSQTETDSDEGTSPIQAETLFELVRQAFGLTPEKHQYYSDIIMEAMGRRAPAKLLVEELVSQLAILENNRHPYYSPQAFLSRNSYDQWQQMERSKISGLINKFWHFALPAPHSAMAKPTYWFNRHEEYNALMNKLLRFESSFKRSSVFFIPLSSSSRRLLREFGLRYGVGELYRKAVYLEYLASNFENEVGLVKHITKTVNQVFSLVNTHHRGRLVMTRNEFDTLQQTVTLLHGQCGNSLTRIKRLFPDNQPPDGLESLIGLLSSVLRLKSVLSGKKERSVEHWLKQYMQESFALTYERHKLIATTELNLNAFTTPLSPRLLNILLFDIRDEISNYRQYYVEVFQPYFNIVQVAAKAFYQFLMDDVKHLCEIAAEEKDSGEIDLMMLSLAYRLNRLDADWAMFILPRAQRWRPCFLQQSSRWLMVLREHLVSLVLQSVGADKYEILKLPAGLEDFTLSLSQDYGRLGPTATQLTQSEGSAFSSVPSSGNMTPRSLQEGVSQEAEAKKRNQTTQPGHANQCNQNDETTPVNRQQYTTSAKSSKGFKGQGQGSSGQYAPVGIDLQFGINDDYKYGLKSRPPTNARKLQGKPNSDGHYTSEDEQILSFAQKVVKSKPNYSDNSMQKVPNRTEVKVEVHRVSMDTSGETEAQKGQGDRKTSDFSSDTIPSCGYGSGSGDSLISDEEVIISKAGKMQGLSEESEKLNNNEPGIYSQAESDTGTAQEDLTTDAVAGTAVESSTETGIVCGEHDSSERITGSNSASTDEDVEESATTSKDALEGALTGVQDSSGSFTSTLKDMTDSVDMKDERRGEDTEIENLENNEITQISANASQHPTPAIDRFSACRTPEDGEVEVAAVEGGEIEVAAGEGGEGDDLDREGETEQSGMEDEEGEGEEDGERVLPITSSLVDVICMIKRLSSFVSTLYEMLCPVHECSDLCMVNGAESVAHLNAMETISKQNLMAAQELFQKMVQAFSSTLCIYADNLLSMDVCATPRVVALKLLGRQLLQHLRWDRKNNHLWGCRHMAAGINSCYQYVSRESQYLCDSFEPVTEEMCSRINNVADLITLIPMFQSMLSQAIPMFDDINQTRSEDFVSDLEDFVVVGDVPHIPTSMTDDDEEETSSAESTTSTSYHSNSSTTRRRSEQTSREARASTSRQSSSELGNVRAYRDRESLVDLVLGHCEWHLNCVKDSLINLLAEKINLFFKQGLSLLVELDMEGFTIEKRLKPLTEFLTNHLEALSQWLYPDCYDRVHLVLWYFIAEDFEQEAYKLKKFHNKAEEKAMLLLQALSYMIEFIHDGGQGLPIDQLIPPAEHVMQLLQLFSWSTKKLINLYHHLVAEKSGDGQTSENSFQVPPRELLQRMRYDLHNIRKCFTGKQLVDWILKNYTIQVPSTEADTSIDICSDIDGAMQLAQRLLDLNVICPTVDELSSISNRLQNPRAESASPLNSPYPEISIHSEPNTMGRHRWTSSESEISTLKRERTSTFGTEDTWSEEKFTEGTEEQRGSETEEGSVGELPRISVDAASEKSVENSNVMPQEGAVAQTPVDAVSTGKENAEGKTKNMIGVFGSRPSGEDTSAVAEDEKNDSQLTKTGVESVERRREDFAGSRLSHEERNKKDKLSADGSETMESSAVRDQSARSSDVRDFHCGIQSPQSTGSRSMTPASSHSTTSDSTSRHSVETHLFMNSTVHLYRFCDVDDEELYSYHSDATIYSARDFPGNTGGNNECHRIKVGMQNKSIDPLYVVTVIFTRKRKDSKAKRLLKHVPKPMLEYLKGESWNFGCF